MKTSIISSLYDFHKKKIIELEENRGIVIYFLLVRICSALMDSRLWFAIMAWDFTTVKFSLFVKKHNKTLQFLCKARPSNMKME